MLTPHTLLAGSVSLREAGMESALAQVRARLDLCGAVLVRQIPTDDGNAMFLSLARGLGTPTDSGPPPTAGHQRSVENQIVHRVEALPVPLRNSNSTAVLSTTAEEFACHTDQYHAEPPPDLVMFLCVRPDAEGRGESLLAHVDAIAAQLDPETRDTLGRAIFPYRFGQTALLTWRDGERRLRFNSYDIECHYQAARLEMPESIRRILQATETAIDAVAVAPLLEAGDCLIVDNTRVLHGRRAFSPGSTRLIKRIRLHSLRRDAASQTAPGGMENSRSFSTAREANP